jgi:hypothetical protein
MEDTIVRDKNNRVHRIQHVELIRERIRPAMREEPTPEELADQYLAKVAPIYQIGPKLLANLSSRAVGVPTRSESQLHRNYVKNIAGSFVVDYFQSYNDIPVWRADFSVHIAQNPMRVTSSISNLHYSIKLGNDSKEAASRLERLTPDALTGFLGLQNGKKVSKINGIKLVIYQYDPDQRTISREIPKEKKAVSFEEAPPALPLPPVPEAIKAGMHYVVAEVLFDLDWPEWKDMHWRALIEPISGAVLYLRALVSAATGKIFRMDPISLTGDTGLVPSASENSLNDLREDATLTDIIPSDPQDLHGNYVDLQEIEPPVTPDPTTTFPFAFNYNVKTTDFSAVNAYYHVNWFFNLIKGLGFDLSTYFDGTTFPVPVDHWSLGGSGNVNAHCVGNVAGNGIGHFCFAAAQIGETVGIADDVRVVIHEFGHALLWDHVNSPNFGFAHSAGDALGAILMDPASVAPDRFLTFPWPQIGTPYSPFDRRHDRSVADGWGWFGSMYDTQYNGEQMLSTTLFRLYSSAGGDSSHTGDRLWAARYVSYLIIKAIGLLTAPTSYPDDYAWNLMESDIGTANFEGQPGGALRKIIRWAFEEQGLYQPNAVPGTTTPVTKKGDPEPVDVYIDDGRHGGYEYKEVFWENEDIWNRHSPDGGTTDETPCMNILNHVYVRVKNRGSETAQNVVVRGFHCKLSPNLVWPNSWTPLITPELSPPGKTVSPGASVVVGPFEWRPQSSQECLLMYVSADGDRSNADIASGCPCASSPTPIDRLVPFDNNIGQRIVSVHLGDGKAFARDFS